MVPTVNVETLMITLFAPALMALLVLHHNVVLNVWFPVNVLLYRHVSIRNVLTHALAPVVLMLDAKLLTTVPSVAVPLARLAIHLKDV